MGIAERMPKRPYVLALLAYLVIPMVIIAGARVFRLIDPEIARGWADYTRGYHSLEMARRGVLMATGGLALVLWVLCCYLVLKARQRSLRWLALAAAGSFGFSVIAALRDRAPAPGDLYQRFIGKLKIYWRVPLEIAQFVSVWWLAYEAMVVQRELEIRYESHMTGTPVATIVEQQSAESGMYAGGEGMEVLYLVPLIYLVWPVLFNLAGHLCSRRSRVALGDR